MMTLATLLVCSMQLLTGADPTSELNVLAVEGTEFHASLETRPLDDASTRHVRSSVVHGNPYVSNDPEFVKTITRAGSQGRIDGAGVRAALWAIYREAEDLGLYGLEAASAADAERLEEALRRIWAHNASLDRALVHRHEQVLVVVWHDGISSHVWEAVNAEIAARLGQ